jgi:hypothetical protein
MKFKVTWLKEEFAIIDAADIKAAEKEGLRLIAMRNGATPTKLLSVHKYEWPTPPVKAVA